MFIVKKINTNDEIETLFEVNEYFKAVDYIKKLNEINTYYQEFGIPESKSPKYSYNEYYNVKQKSPKYAIIKNNSNKVLLITR